MGPRARQLARCAGDADEAVEVLAAMIAHSQIMMTPPAEPTPPFPAGFCRARGDRCRGPAARPEPFADVMRHGRSFRPLHFSAASSAASVVAD